MTEHEGNQILTCREVVALVTDYLEEALQPEVQIAVTEHLEGCDNCSTYYAQMRRTIEMLRQLTQEPMFPETKEELLQKFREWRD